MITSEPDGREALAAGAPALSLPVGLDGAGLPIGTQLIGWPFGEATLLGVGRAVGEARASLARPAPLAA
ncbi:hypothetical protein ACGFLS_04210 [Streptomyces abikoensis]|uniref:hypothetical protein n=1 Tax=Streptomyces abikoensis TaxID=97398 RepID=UPI0037221A18